MKIPSNSSSSVFYKHNKSQGVSGSWGGGLLAEGGGGGGGYIPTSAAVVCKMSFTAFSGVAGVTSSGSGVPYIYRVRVSVRMKDS